ncbi:MAG: hypothetical protein NT080_01700 [Spirochaetes bacterium]|nr:hypothetical protein [Spirochaetota bacterium]
MARRLAIAVLLVLAGIATAAAADLSVPLLEIDTRGGGDDSGTFALSSRILCDILLSGGTKFAAELKLGLDAYGAEEGLMFDELYPAEADDRTDFRLRGAAVTARDLFGSPVSVSWFVGHSDLLGTGDDFVRRFGVLPFASEFRGPAAFPDGIGGNPMRWYDGLYEICGTGMRVEAGTGRSFLSAWLYQDTRLGLGVYSGDVRALVVLRPVSLEVHAGATSPASDWGIYRAGILFHVSTGSIGGILLQAGLPYIDPAASDPLGSDRIFFLFETTLRFDPAAVVVTFFKHPGWYLQAPTGEGGMMDCSVDLRIGDELRHGMRGGVKTTVGFDSDAASDPFTLRAVPYYNVIADGVAWNFSLGIRIMPYPGFAPVMFEPAVSAKTSF